MAAVVIVAAAIGRRGVHHHRRRGHAEPTHARSCASTFVDPRAGYPNGRGGARLIDGLARHAQVAPAPPQILGARSVCPD